jgi:hypothetical protein
MALTPYYEGMGILNGNWIEVKDGDPRAVSLFRRHYSCRDPKVDYCRYGFSGNGESMVLLTLNCDALFNWRQVIGEGINCSIFHNESDLLSSDLIKEADGMAWQRWVELRHYTYVNSKKILSNHPGYCFLHAGWDYQRDQKGKPILSKGGLYVLEIFKQ